MNFDDIKELITLSILSHERKNKNESILKRGIINDITFGWNVPSHATSIYRAMHQTIPHLKQKCSPSKAYESK